MLDTGTSFGPISATKPFRFFLVARDSHGNLFDDCQRRRIKAKLWSAETPTSPAFSMVCELHPTKALGVYVSHCTVKKAGVHCIGVQYSSNQYQVMGNVIISAGPPDASKSEICDILEGTLTISLEERSNCKLILRDQFSNICKGVEASLQSVTAEVSGSADTPPNCGFKCELIPNQDQPVTSVVLPSKYLLFLHVRVSGRDVIGSPTILQYKSNTNFKQRVAKLRKSLACHNYTPTLTMDRNHLLETAVNLLQPSMFRKTIRVRFGDEQGIDCGGVSR